VEAEEIIKMIMKTSILGNKWEILEADGNRATFIANSLSVSYSVGEILSLKGDLTLEEMEDFLRPSVKKLMPNPLEAFLDIDIAINRIIDAITKKQNIVIFGDYDVDGGASSALFKRFFEMIGIKSKIYIPDRIKEGYGPNTNALLNLRKEGADLVITVDCGTVAFEPLSKANEAGLEIIVIDHHLGVKEKPESIAVINPNRFDETSNLNYLCGAGVSFMLIVGLNMTLRKIGFYQMRGLKEPNLLSLLDLVALATICDVMPLVGLNRAFVKTGLEVIRHQTNIGIKSLLAIAGSETQITEFTLGFVIGPRINAGGRIGRADLGATLLSTTSEEEAMQIALKLNELNANRKEMEEASLELAISKIESDNLHAKEIIFVEDASFHQGIIGILASRIKDRYNKPVAVFSRLDGYLKASLRSIATLDIGTIIHKAHGAGLLMAGGGHAMAGGLSVLDVNYTKLLELFEEEIKRTEFSFNKTIFLSSVISINSINEDLCLELLNLTPFGNANPKPVFCIKDVVVIKFDVLKNSHLSIIVKDVTSGKSIKAMLFKAKEIGALEKIPNLLGREIDIACEITLNEWNGTQNPVLHIVDLVI
jgi:single-stranded-DNA-specific exonuclease